MGGAGDDPGACAAGTRRRPGYLDILGVNLDCNHWHDSGLRDYAIALVSEYLSRGWHVIATVRSTSRQSDLRDLQRHAGDALEIEQVDMTDAEQIALMSSRLASVTNNVAGGWDVYRASKAAVNTLMRCFAARHEGDGRAIVLVAPSWIRTALGGQEAPFDAETNIKAVVDVIERRSIQPGLHFVDFRGHDVAW